MMTCRQVYETLLDIRKRELLTDLRLGNITEDKFNRMANIYAVRNTVKKWRKQYGS